MRRILSGHFEVELPAVDAIGLFTPDGERDWVPGWNPVYSTDDTSEEAGTVFTTDVGGGVQLATAKFASICPPAGPQTQ